MKDIIIPWEDRKNSSSELLWRYSQNPVIKRDHIKASNSIFNSAVVKFGSGYAGVFRCDNLAREMRIHAGFSDDGINWKIDEDPIKFICDNEEISDFEYAYDPRVTYLDGKYYVTWCNGYHGPTIGVAWTTDFRKFYQTENAFLPYNRNGVMFPKKINDKFAMLSRPSDTGHTPFGDIFYSESPDLIYWGKHRHVMSKQGVGWESTKIGAGPVPIETNEGWLLIYHGVLTSCNGFVYHFGGALLDLEKPWKVIARGKNYLFNPREIYELAGDVPNVTFPCAALTDDKNEKIAIYYGAADTVTGLCFGNINEIVDYIKKDSSI
ncbi:MAG: glycoside hydrolase family 130 protein [Candidatus Delongbacteria bacterium]|nr:glycoside hydrolase family 130 protein [Candidatus Delongbacteria bacterium]MBN2835655.1 glycoside hydrolase family 130 protein [Candidatus Delongbacteria bacterium]